MKIEFRLPSKKVQYGYVNVDGTAAELAKLDYEKLGRDYLNAVMEFWGGELGQFDAARAQEEPEIIRHPKTDVPTPVVDVELPDEDEAVSLVTEELGATKISEEVYDEPVKETVKPWASSSFDFGS